MALRVVLRALSHHYIRRETRDGPFLLQPTDLHASNIFVDEDRNTCLLDPEWISALPLEMPAVPHWNTGCSIDEIQGDKYRELDQAHQEFLQILEET